MHFACVTPRSVARPPTHATLQSCALLYSKTFGVSCIPMLRLHGPHQTANDYFTPSWAAPNRQVIFNAFVGHTNSPMIMLRLRGPHQMTNGYFTLSFASPNCAWLCYAFACLTKSPIDTLRLHVPRKIADGKFTPSRAAPNRQWILYAFIGRAKSSMSTSCASQTHQRGLYAFMCRTQWPMII